MAERSRLTWLHKITTCIGWPNNPLEARGLVGPLLAVPTRRFRWYQILGWVGTAEEALRTSFSNCLCLRSVRELRRMRTSTSYHSKVWAVGEEAEQPTPT